ncbi:hypothetical protein BGX23_004266 [Mortierella sp. AD031]|nr:hypothetical protein BGX23_004266 [Mortierella sp. AD031]
MLHRQQGSSVQVTIHSAERLKDLDGDIYVNVSLEVDNNIAYRRTRTRTTRAGSDIVWEETVFLNSLGRGSGNADDENLYVEIMEKSKTSSTDDRPIGFAAIPLGIIAHVYANRLSAIFDLYHCYNDGDVDARGGVALTIQIMPRVPRPRVSSFMDKTATYYDGGFPNEYSFLEWEQKERFMRLCMDAGVELPDRPTSTSDRGLGVVEVVFLLLVLLLV